jgi:hypothetical protein
MAVNDFLVDLDQLQKREHRGLSKEDYKELLWKPRK